VKRVIKGGAAHSSRAVLSGMCCCVDLAFAPNLTRGR
jgi:hypothetical protein